MSRKKTLVKKYMQAFVGPRTKAQYYRYLGEVYFEPAAKPLPSSSNDGFKMLVALPSPRDIPEFLDSVDACLYDHDKMWFKYFRYEADPPYRPYPLIREYFMRYKNKRGYTHLAILPDDLVINRKGVEKLIRNVKSNPSKYQVMMGTCSVTHESDELAYTSNLPSLKRGERVYEWCSRSSSSQQPRRNKKKIIIQVSFCGTPLAILSKEVVEKVTLSDDSKWNRDSDDVGSSEDLVLCHELAQLGIPIWVDTSVYFDHLKGLDVAYVS